MCDTGINRLEYPKTSGKRKITHQSTIYIYFFFFLFSAECITNSLVNPHIGNSPNHHVTSFLVKLNLLQKYEGENIILLPILFPAPRCEAPS